MAKKSFLKRKSVRIVGIVILVLIVLAVGLELFGGSMIKAGIQTAGSALTKCDISVEKVRFSMLRGHFSIQNLTVSNPEGFKTPSAFTLTKVQIDLVPSSLFSKKVVVKEVQIIDPEVTYEVDPLKFKSNIGAIQNNVTSFLPAGDDKKEEKEEKEEEPKEKKEGKKVQIDHVLIQGGQINVSATIAGGYSLPVPLPKIEMNDIGKEKEVTPPEATASILNRMFTGIIDAGNEAIKKVGAGLQGVGNAIGSGTKSIGEGVKSLGNMLGIGGKEK